MMDKKRRKKVKLGDIYAIPLPNGKYAFGRVFKYGAIAIYKYIGNSFDDIPKEEDYQFLVGVYRDVLQDGVWIIVGNHPFLNDEEAEPPIQCIIDSVDGGYSTYYKGKITKSDKKQCEGLEEVAAWDAHHIIDRIMGDDKWHKKNKF